MSTHFTAVTVAPKRITANYTVDRERDSGKVLFFDIASGATATLPAAIGSGATFKFFVNTAVTSNNAVIKVANTTDIMKGNIIANSTGDTPDLAQPWPTAADSDTITMDGSTKGGAGGDYITLVDVKAGIWAVIGFTMASGTEATPFSASV